MPKNDLTTKTPGITKGVHIQTGVQTSVKTAPPIDKKIIQKVTPLVNAINDPPIEQKPAVKLPNMLDMLRKEDDALLTSFKDTAIPHYSYKQTTLYLDLAYTSKQPLLIYGSAGEGKSSIVVQYAKNAAKAKGKIFVEWNKTTSQDEKLAILKNPEKYFTMIDVRVAGAEPTDVIGTPNIQPSIPKKSSNKVQLNQSDIDDIPEEVSEIKPYLELKQLMWIYYMSLPESDGILFLDELNRGHEQTLNAFFSVVLDRVAGQTSFSPNWGIIAAGNMGEEFNIPALDPALVNRFTCGALIADQKGFTDFGRKPRTKTSSGQLMREIVQELDIPPKYLTLTPEEMNYVNDNEQAVNEFIIAFINSDQSNLRLAAPPNPGDPFPSPRQFEKLSLIIDILIFKYYQAELDGDPIRNPTILTAIIQQAGGLCGTPWAIKFKAFLQHMQLFDMEKIRKDTNLSKINSDKYYALSSYLASQVKQVATPKINSEGITEDKRAIEIMNTLFHVCLSVDDREKVITILSMIMSQLNITQKTAFGLYFANGEIWGGPETKKQLKFVFDEAKKITGYGKNLTTESTGKQLNSFGVQKFILNQLSGYINSEFDLNNSMFDISNKVKIDDLKQIIENFMKTTIMSSLTKKFIESLLSKDNVQEILFSLFGNLKH